MQEMILEVYSTSILGIFGKHSSVLKCPQTLRVYEDQISFLVEQMPHTIFCCTLSPALHISKQGILVKDRHRNLDGENQARMSEVARPSLMLASLVSAGHGLLHSGSCRVRDGMT